jgi:16S rRNA (adenine1518-N6/adenine1519-N6)-dimethyltransferase
MPRARRRFGQHFLEPQWVQKIVDAIAPAPDDLFLEIGPGRGALTLALAPRVQRLIAIEVDRDLAALLAEHAPPHVKVVTADFLAVDAVPLIREAAGDRPIRVAGNLPYNISSPILFKLLDVHREARIVDATLLLQREVVDRIVAAPGGKEYGVLSVLVQRHAHVRRVLSIPPGAFRPAPQVHSALVRLTFHDPEPTVRDERVFSLVVRDAFQQRRKKLANTLKALAGSRGRDVRALLAGAGIDGDRRPETLSLAEFGRLSDAMSASGNGAKEPDRGGRGAR